MEESHVFTREPGRTAGPSKQGWMGVGGGMQTVMRGEERGGQCAPSPGPSELGEGGKPETWCSSPTLTARLSFEGAGVYSLGHGQPPLDLKI